MFQAHDATPVVLPKLMKINKPVVQVSYELNEVGDMNLEKVLESVKSGVAA